MNNAVVKNDSLLALVIIALFVVFLVVLASKQELDFDASYNMLSYQSLFDGKGFAYTYNGNITYFDPVISTGPELYFPVFLIWKALGETQYFVATYVLIGYYLIFLLLFNYYVLRHVPWKTVATLAIFVMVLCTWKLFGESVILNPKGEPIAAMFVFVGLFLMKENKYPLLACLVLGFALDLKTNISVAVFPCFSLVVYGKIIDKAIKKCSFVVLMRKVFVVVLYLFVMLIPYISYTKIIPYMVLDKEQFSTLQTQQKLRADFMFNRGFGQILLLKKWNAGGFRDFTSLFQSKCLAVKDYYKGSATLAALFLCSLLALTLFSFRFDHFSCYLFLFVDFLLLWWLLCPLDIWYRYFSIIDFLYIFGIASIIPVLFVDLNKYSRMICLSLLCLLFFPRFTLAVINNNSSLCYAKPNSMLEIGTTISSLEEGQIFTYGWFQAPQLMFLTHKRFNDFLDKDKLELARKKYGDVFFLSTIENTIIQPEMDGISEQLVLLKACELNVLSKILINKQIKHYSNFANDRNLNLREGWYDLEGAANFRYRWTASKFSLILPAGTSRINFSAFVPPNSTGENCKSIKLIVDGKELGRLIGSLVEGKWQIFQIELAQPLTKEISGVFELNYTYCPNDFGDGKDMRKLGLLVSKIEYSLMPTA